MYILGVSCFFHDSAAALLADGELVAAAEEERFTRKKHDFEFPVHAIDFCLRIAGIRGEDVELAVFFEKPFLKFERILATAAATYPSSGGVFQKAMLTWLKDKLWIRSLLADHLKIDTKKVVFSEHHVSHAASSFYCSPFEDAAILTVDGVGEWTTASFGEGHGTDIKLRGEIRFPHSIGLLYSAFTAFLGFEVNEGEYKVMGMAPFGRPKFLDEVRKLYRLGDDGSFRLDMKYFSFHQSPTETYNDRFIDLFGAARAPESYFFTKDSGYPSYFGDKPADFDRQAETNQHYADVAASIQVATEEILLHMAKHVRSSTGASRLCMAGGVALNSVANGRILRDAGFDEIFIQPAAGDGGGALGAALWGYHAVAGHPRKFRMTHAYWGEEHSDGVISDFLRAQSLKHQTFDDQDGLVGYVADQLQNGAVVGWMQGRFELGPRALGNRSILADPRRTDMKETVNTKIKFREPFRPFAPAVLAHRAKEYFEPKIAEQLPARFMLMVADVAPAARSKIPAVTHVDGTGRIQTVYSDSNPLFFRLLSKFDSATGVPVLLNTSFNLRGEPIVNTPAEALSSFSRSGMDLLVLGNSVIKKSDLC
ncbi:MAG TPA: carbamoyltransferase N-terminal domain-containing protein [Candidatus Binataceae bacterium]|nr:carbamoyltransferase N-terminal domain-containing protein [Candidatus Binataceae bacterium]